MQMVSATTSNAPAALGHGARLMGSHSFNLPPTRFIHQSRVRPGVWSDDRYWLVFLYGHLKSISRTTHCRYTALCATPVRVLSVNLKVNFEIHIADRKATTYI